MGLACSSNLLLLLSLVSLCVSDDQLSPAKPLIFPDDKLISNNGFFALGLFSPTNSSTRFYLDIWYNNDPEHTVVWVANRDNPITTSSSSSTTLTVTNRSELVLSDHEGRIYWSTPSTGGADATGVSVVLLNEGNLVFRSSNGTILWQSFDHPTDTVLAGMPIQMNIHTRFVDRLVSWKGPEDPSTGGFSLAGDVTTGIQYFICHGSNISWRSSALNSFTVSSRQTSDTSPIIITSFVINGDEISMTYNIPDGSLGMRTRLSYAGRYEISIWNSSLSAWTVLDAFPRRGCDQYAYCGPFSFCDSTERVPICKCLEGFEPHGTSPSRGCARKEKLRCGDGDHFVTLTNVKTPAMPVFVRNRSLDGCVAECLGNCSCTAYAYANLSNAISGGDQSRCLMWFSELVDMGKYEPIMGENLYLRLAGSTSTPRSLLVFIFCEHVISAASLCSQFPLLYGTHDICLEKLVYANLATR
ncbi:hypothetical protein QOZ80_4BG0333600 [Eleusine coracana subsp. coracana]|nr:hypothetical protein QOZ80_4BG0333600 [Eleusine coracana subsp. coracana]